MEEILLRLAKLSSENEKLRKENRQLKKEIKEANSK